MPAAAAAEQHLTTYSGGVFRRIFGPGWPIPRAGQIAHLPEEGPAVKKYRDFANVLICRPADHEAAVATELDKV